MTESRLSRREILRLGLLAPAALTAACWDGGPWVGSKLYKVSLLNDWLSENVWLSSTRLAPQYPISQRTRARDFPAYAQTRPFLPVPADPANWSLKIGGLVEKPFHLTVAMAMTLPRVTYTVKHHCVEGWTAIATWTGVPVATLIAMAQPKPAARYIRFDTFDNGYANGWDIKSAMHPQTILAYAWNDRQLTSAHGAPLRLYSPVKLGYKLTKFVSAMTFTSERPGGFWEDQGYPWFGGI
jgi:DMSO/TMAO reductase YedYZ molybdopterin-dependent catalytic subunit